jgi:hypothetical protein
LFAEDARLHDVGPPDIALGVELLARARKAGAWEALLRAPQRTRDAFAARGHRYKVAVARYATNTAGTPEQGVRRALTKVDPELEEVTMGWGQEMREQGRAQGLEEGLERGRELGRTQGLADTLLRLGARRFGTARPRVLQWVRSLSEDQLTAVLDRLLDASSWDDLRR